MSNGSPVFHDELLQRSDRGLEINCESAEMETTVDEEERCSNALNTLELDQPSLSFIFMKQK